MKMERKKLEHLLKANHEDAYLWSLRCCHGDPENAKDVLQNVYLKILEDRARYNSQAAFKTWLFSVIRFTAIDMYRQVKSFEDLGEESIRISTGSQDNDYYRNLLNELPLRQQEIMLLYFYHDLTLEDIANVLDIHVGTVRTHFARGKTALRAKIRKEEV